jgi:hypothetical protein
MVTVMAGLRLRGFAAYQSPFTPPCHGQPDCGGSGRPRRAGKIGEQTGMAARSTADDRPNPG